MSLGMKSNTFGTQISHGYFQLENKNVCTANIFESVMFWGFFYFIFCIIQSLTSHAVACTVN